MRHRGSGPRPRSLRGRRRDDGADGPHAHRRGRHARRGGQDEAAIADVFAAVQADHGRIDVLMNVAGVAGGGPVHSMESDEWDRLVGINLKGTFLTKRS